MCENIFFQEMAHLKKCFYYLAQFNKLKQWVIDLKVRATTKLALTLRKKTPTKKGSWWLTGLKFFFLIPN